MIVVQKKLFFLNILNVFFKECNELTDYLQNEFSTGTYTHHQKSIISDASIVGGGNGARRLVAFVGGLDLTGGRWDTPNHELYSTLLEEHSGDFRNSNAKTVPAEQGPRQPWHDIHSRYKRKNPFILSNNKTRVARSSNKD